MKVQIFICMVRVNDLPHMLAEELLYPSSAGLLKLAMKSQLFKERGLLQDTRDVLLSSL